MIYSLSDFVREYKKICEMGWIKTHRAGSTGIGKTLEDILGIPENNIDAPDFGEYETHDYGTGFRIKENDQPLLFRFIKRIV